MQNIAVQYIYITVEYIYITVQDNYSAVHITMQSITVQYEYNTAHLHYRAVQLQTTPLQYIFIHCTITHIHTVSRNYKSGQRRGSKLSKATMVE